MINLHDNNVFNNNLSQNNKQRGDVNSQNNTPDYDTIMNTLDSNIFNGNIY